MKSLTCKGTLDALAMNVGTFKDSKLLEVCVKIVTLIFITFGLLFLSGCSSTWNGVKEDSSRAWNSTKEAINKATE